MNTHQNMPVDRPADPPKVPQVPRKFRLYGFQVIGLSLLMLIPILALAGVFGVNYSSTTQTDNGIRLTVEYGNRCHYRTTTHLRTAVHNQRGEALTSVTVSFSRDYLAQFTDITFIPVPTRLTAIAYEVDLATLPPDATRMVDIELKCEFAGQHSGTIAVKVADEPQVQAEISTLAFP